MELKIIYRSISELMPSANNARTHSDEQVKQIANSIALFGFNNPVLLDEDKNIIAGHGRILAAQILKLKKAPTITLKHLTPELKKAYLIADNKLAANSSWDIEQLGTEVRELTENRFDVSVLGFDKNELDNLLTEDLTSLITSPETIFINDEEPEKDPKEKKPRAISKSKLVHTCPKCKHEFSSPE
jgi:ParB family transcriptional regulator, chromosome partitioning protein